MTPKERDDVIYALNQVQSFYNKTLDDLQLRFWMRALQQYEAKDIMTALADYTATGKYAPKPADIIDAIKTLREQSRRTEQPSIRRPDVRMADPKTARAWQYMIKLWGMGNLYKITEVDDDTAGEYLTLCNRQAMMNKNPDAIPPDGWLSDVWGCTRDEALAAAR